MRKFATFESMCREAGLKARDCGQGHWRIEGGLVTVNWYPWSKGSTVWINGTSGRTSFPGTAEMAIAAARGQAQVLAPGARPTERLSSSKARSVKRGWWRRFSIVRCRWCGLALERHQITIDHVIPLFRGGSNLPDNLVPACEPCNKKRGHELGAPK